jgi:hypothetical protein
MVYVLVGVHNSASGPALGTVRLLLKIVITISSVVIVPHDPLLIVQRKVFVPKLNPETPLIGEVEFAKVPVPFIKLHDPVDGNDGVFAASVADVVGKQYD